MSAASSILAAGLRVLGTATDRTVEYRATKADSWATVEGATASVVQSEPQYDETGNVHQVLRTGVVRVPVGGTALASGGQIRLDKNDADIFAIRGKAFGTAVDSYAIASAATNVRGPDRGRSRE